MNKVELVEVSLGNCDGSKLFSLKEKVEMTINLWNNDGYKVVSISNNISIN